MTNPLTDVLPPKYRRWLYAALALAGLVISVAQILGYDMTRPAAIVTVVAGTFGLGLAHGNTKAPRE